MEIIVTGIDRGLVTARADTMVIDAAAGNEYTIDFSIYSGNTLIDSSLEVIYEGDLTFSEAKDIVKKCLNIQE